MFPTVRRSAALALVAYILPAQVDTSTDILRFITGSSGAPVADATVKIRNAAIGEERHTKIDADGLYSLPSVAPGTNAVSGNLCIGGRKCISNRV
jgi:hypothetical protein